LDIAPIWKFKDGINDFSNKTKSFAFVYKRRNSPLKIKSGDWLQRLNPLEEIKRFLNTQVSDKVNPEDLINYLHKYLKK